MDDVAELQQEIVRLKKYYTTLVRAIIHHYQEDYVHQGGREEFWVVPDKQSLDTLPEHSEDE